MIAKIKQYINSLSYCDRLLYTILILAILQCINLFVQLIKFLL